MIGADDIAQVSADGMLRFRGQMLRCALGSGGISARKHEGDGATPCGLLPLERVLWRADRGPKPQAAVRVEPLAPNDGWCDDETHADYNRQITLPHEGRHEVLWRDDAVYDVIGVLGWNMAPVTRGRGSAIFLHIARPGLAPTEGCIALPERELRALLAQGLRGFQVG
jgi:L,D-peptidoglycan transpeptidase YkuD (ErfK/YbiS/YcfS/YnhG family)